MAVFKDIKLTYNGRDFIIKSNRVMDLIAELEDIVSIKRLTKNREDIPLAKLASAYAAALTYAGAANVDREKIYQSCFMKGEALQIIEAAITGLMFMMIPPPELMPRLEAEEKKDKPKVTKKS